MAEHILLVLLTITITKSEELHYFQDNVVFNLF